MLSTNLRLNERPIILAAGEIRCRFIFSGKNDELTPDFYIFSGKNDELTPDFYIFSGKNDELTPDFYELTPDF